MISYYELQNLRYKLTFLNVFLTVHHELTIHKLPT